MNYLVKVLTAEKQNRSTTENFIDYFLNPKYLLPIHNSIIISSITSSRHSHIIVHSETVEKFYK